MPASHVGAPGFKSWLRSCFQLPWVAVVLAWGRSALSPERLAFGAGLALAVVRIWGVNQQMEDLSLLCKEIKKNVKSVQQGASRRGLGEMSASVSRSQTAGTEVCAPWGRGSQWDSGSGCTLQLARQLMPPPAHVPAARLAPLWEFPGTRDSPAEQDRT